MRRSPIPSTSGAVVVACPHLLKSFSDATTLQHFDASELAPSSASLADIALVNHDVRFAPESEHSAVQDKCPLSANSGHFLYLFDHLVGPSEQRDGYLYPDRLGGLEIYD